MGVMKRLQALDAKTGAFAPRNADERNDFIERLARHARGFAGPALRALAAEALDQRREILALQARLLALEPKASAPKGGRRQDSDLRK